MAEVTEETDVVKNPATGRDAVIDAYRSVNPKTGEEIDDTALWDFSNGRYSELEEKYNNLNGSNQKLAELIANNPQLGAFISMIAGEDAKSVPYALSRVFGKDALELDGDALEDYEKGNGEYLSALESSRKEQEVAQENFKQFDNNFAQFVTDNGLDEAQSEAVKNGVLDMAESILMGNIPANVIDLVYKGMNYDRDVQEAAETGVVEGKNQAIDKAKVKKIEGGMPDLNASTGSGEIKKRPTKKGSFFDGMKEVD